MGCSSSPTQSAHGIAPALSSIARATATMDCAEGSSSSAGFRRERGRFGSMRGGLN